MLLKSFLLFLLFSVSACSLPGVDEDPDTLKIAVIAPLSDDFESLGQSTHNGVVLAVEEWNERGGVLEQPVQVILKDSLCDYETGREVAQDVINEGAKFIIGAVCASASEGVAQVAMEQNALQITHASVNEDLTLDVEGEVRPLVFRVPFIDPVQGMVAARFSLEDLGAERAAFLYTEDSAYGSALVQAFETVFEDGAGEIVARETYEQDAESFFDVLDRIREAQPDVIYAPGYHTIANRLVSQARAFGLSQVIIGSDGWDSPDLRLENVNRTYFTTHFFIDEPRAAVQTWAQQYETRFIVPPDVLATMAYDATNMLLSAIDEADTLVPTLVAEEMEKMAFEVVSGEIKFDERHNPLKPVLLLRVQDGQLLFVDRVVLEQE